MVMLHNKYFNLYCFSWVITLIAMWFIYAGLHPDAVCSFFIKNYAKTLLIFANLPPLTFSLLNWYKNKKKSINIFIIIFTILIQFFILK